MEIIKYFYSQIEWMDNFIGNMDYLIEIYLKLLFSNVFFIILKFSCNFYQSDINCCIFAA